MPQAVTGAVLMCTMGLGPTTLNVTPSGPPVTIDGLPAANITHMAPMVNIPPFPMCNSILNPVVAAATAAKLGVFTPAACVPTPAGPWTPGNPTVMINGSPCINEKSMCMCAYGGMISITFPGQVKVQT
jgi:uncharacterized Zn-binding protein involved in type VI secretion